MSFASQEFYIFFAVVFLVYLLLSHKLQNALLLIASYFFYGYWDWRFASILLLSTWISYFCGLMIEKNNDAERKKRYLLLALLVNLTILGLFKYANFFIGQLNNLLAQFGQDSYRLNLHIIVPLGISFYIFQSLSYTIDIYREVSKPTKNFIDHALYVSFFPQLIAGPIERANHLLPQIQKKRNISLENLKTGAHLIYWGLFKKIFIADNCALIAERILSKPFEYPIGAILVGIYAFAFRMYCDISGYTDIARGTAKCMGFDLAINFRLPYFSRNISDFWRRWHISVTSWFRDYVFFPLLVHTKGNAYFSAFMTLFCIAIWHSLSLNSILRGIYFGLLIILYRLAKEKFPWHNQTGKNKFIASAHSFVSSVITFHLVCIGWLFFLNIESKDILRFAGSFLMNFNFNGFTDQFHHLFRYIWVLLSVQALQAVKKDEFIILKTNILVRVILYWFMFWALFGGTGGIKMPFIYFRI